MYGYNRAMFGMGQVPTLEDIAKKWRLAPSAEFNQAFQNKDSGEVVYGNAVGAAEARARPDKFIDLGYAPGYEPKWYKDPLILGGAAVVGVIIVLGVFLRKK